QTGGHVPAALILHWDSRTWSKVPAPAATGDRFLSDVAAVSARNVWAVGSAVGRRFASQPYMIHWAGSSWMQVPAPHLRAQFPSLQSVAVGSDGTAWAVGLSGEQHLNA